MTLRKRVPAPTAIEARTHTQTPELPRTREGVCVPEGPHAHRSTSKRPVDALAGSFHARRVLSAALFLTAVACFIAAVVELPEHVGHAAGLIVAGAFLWFTGEAAS